MGAFIEMVGISKVYSQGNSVTKALDNLSLVVKEGAFLEFSSPTDAGCEKECGVDSHDLRYG